MYYTLGQRKGLGIGGVAGEEQSRWYVVEKRLSDNTLVVSCGEGEELFSRALNASGLNVIGPWDKKVRMYGKIPLPPKRAARFCGNYRQRPRKNRIQDAAARGNSRSVCRAVLWRKMSGRRGYRRGYKIIRRI